MKPLFRLAQRADIGDILSIYNDSKTQLFSLWDDDYPINGDIENDPAHHNLFVLCEKTTIIGCISIVFENEPDELPCFENRNAEKISRVAIRRKYQGYHYSCLMIEEIEKEPLKRGVDEIHLPVGVRNIPAYRTYMRENFVCLEGVSMFNHEYMPAKRNYLHRY